MARAAIPDVVDVTRSVDRDYVIVARERQNEQTLVEQGIPRSVFEVAGMSPIHQLKLLTRRKDLVDNVDISEICDELQSKLIFKANEMEVAKSKPSGHERMRYILDKLPTKGPEAYPYFRHALKEAYPWLVKELDGTVITRKTMAQFCQSHDVDITTAKKGEMFSSWF